MGYLYDLFIKESKGSLNKTVSPTVKITDIDNGHRVTVTDIAGEKSFDVMNGETREDITNDEIDAIISETFEEKEE